MDLKEARDKKEKLEKDIQALVNAFMNETELGVSHTNLGIIPPYTGGFSSGYVYVSVQVEL
jgi:hypothetical protein